MRTPQRALLLVGSPRPGASTSQSLGTYLLQHLEQNGLHTETMTLTKALRSAEATEALHAAVAAADVLVLSFPLYVDSLPAPTIKALELIAARRAGDVTPAGGPPSLAAIVQCGFPEASHNAVALEICRTFARQAGFDWAGGLAMGGGGIISGRSLAEVGGRVRSQARALDLAAEALSRGRQVPDDAVQLMAKPAIPAFLYRFVANRKWHKAAKELRSGALEAQPLAPAG